MGIAGKGLLALLRCMDDPPALGPVPHFPPRELEVLRLMCHPACWLEKQMPAILGMALGTFKRHKEKVYWKCKVRSRHELIVKAVQWRLVGCYCTAPHAPVEALVTAAVLPFGP